MANEITITTGIRLVNGSLEVLSPAKSRQFDQTTARGGGPGVVDIGTTEESISFGDCVPGYVEAVNLDATNYVTLRFTSSNNAIRLRAGGGVALFELEPGVTLRAIANTATCRVKFTAINL